MFGQVGNWFNGLFGSGNAGISARTPTGVAIGGYASAGQPMVVGELGRELWVPDVGGSIVPNHKIADMGGTRVV